MQEGDARRHLYHAPFQQKVLLMQLVKQIYKLLRTHLHQTVVEFESRTKAGLQQKELLRKFEASLSHDGGHKPREQTFFDGVKKFFTGAVD